MSKVVGIGIKLLKPDAFWPVYATAGAMCFDLKVYAPGEAVIVRPGERRVVNTGLAFDLPAGWGLNVYSRSGHGFRFGVSLANGTGKVDPDYRGEMLICLSNSGMLPLHVNHGDRIAQAEPVQVHRALFHEVQDLSHTERGAGGFGSTGDR